MRNNQPVTQKERHLDLRRPLVSVTDLNGTIRHANSSFIEISGFSQQELIGQSHNIVRHPDMPQAAFEDMWDTIKADLPWRGLVKNRCKNGDFYWVDAYVTPVLDQGKKTGYMSVRRRPEAHKVRQAETLYAAVRNNKTEFPVTQHKREMSLKVRLLLLACFPVICLAAELFAVDSWRWIVSLVGVIAAAALGGWTYLGIMSPLQRLGKAMNRIASGDLSCEMDTGAATECSGILVGFQSMTINLSAMIADMVVIGGDIESQSGTLNNQVQFAIQRSRLGAENICTMAAAVEELSASVSDIAQFTRQSAGQATAAAQQVEQGVQQIASTLVMSKGVVARMDKVQALITELDAEIISIRQLAQNIRGIADQTNLLALNAAIEAARAGESGRGFAVVADEVRNLAARTSNSTVEIATTVERIGSCTANTLEAIAIAAAEVQDCSSMMDDSQSTYEVIKQSVDDIQNASRDIADMLQQQKIATSEVAGNIEQINTLMDQNSKSVDLIRDASTQLDATAHQLRQMTSRFEPST